MKSLVSFTRKHQQSIFCLIFLQYWLATLGSLYYSTFGDPVTSWVQSRTLIGDPLTPCTLCWFARILMYPGVFISLVGIIKNDKKFTDYTLALAMPGIALEIYHYAIQKLALETSFTCSLANPCSALQVNYFGFITIPFLCLVAFMVVGGLSFLNSYAVRKVEERSGFLQLIGWYSVVCSLFLLGLFIF